MDRTVGLNRRGNDLLRSTVDRESNPGRHKVYTADRTAKPSRSLYSICVPQNHHVFIIPVACGFVQSHPGVLVACEHISTDLEPGRVGHTVKSPRSMFLRLLLPFVLLSLLLRVRLISERR